MSLPVEVLSLGRFARAALASGPARAIAVFERSAYLETPAGLACIGVVGNGPLNAHCAMLPPGIAPGQRVLVDLARVAAWLPPPLPGWDAGRAARGLQRLRAACAGRLPREGFGGSIASAQPRTPAMLALAHWLAEPSGLPHAAAGLIGLGPGLTPAGDDVIGGALCALHAAGRRDCAQRLATWVLELARDATSRISRAHLACTAEGDCGEAVHAAIAALMAGETPELNRIDAIGHTSGWDALAGVVLALDAMTGPAHAEPGMLEGAGLSARGSSAPIAR